MFEDDGGGGVTPRKPANPDAISRPEAANILGVPMSVVKILIRQGVLHRVPGQFPSLSKAQVEERARNPQSSEWVTGTEAAHILGLSTTRVWQLALKDRLPFEYATSGRRRYRRAQIEVISRARQIRWHPVESD